MGLEAARRTPELPSCRPQADGASVVAVLQVTPNGPWGKDVHPNMPISIDELVTELRECLQAGATGVHLHVRDRSGAETLNPPVVNRTCQHVREAAEEMGVPVEIGLTT